ncbi:hypothetical protein HANVADRAFT_52460 [Hanseniaspora valbyensis NRRL Y-1626]|uniref:TATA-binding protein-associated factor mot1 n=1 Tax=Hanseniaspora valbyensis NRRL Y-1626 TaxID=766949 RepID=A0A1B7TEH8_9ASCO|nr:hypothetical protein HANVADRAFT_52460 [Hanseniaspora valbyensis NRRL Y-1626]
MTSRSSRLDRQVLLLETGSSTFVRNLAADQLGDLAKQHPNDIISLISRIYPFLLNSKWETRIASARAIGNIVQYLPDWNPDLDDALMKELNDDEQNHVKKEEEFDENAMINSNEQFLKKIEYFKNSDLWAKIIELENDLLSLEDYDVLNIMQNKPPLLAASLDSIKDAKQSDSPQPSTKKLKQEPLPVNNIPNATEDAKTSAKSARMKALAKRKLKRGNISPGDKQTATTPVNKPIDLSSNKLNDIAAASQINGNNSNNVKSESLSFSNPKLDITEQSNDSNKIMLESKIQNENDEDIAGITWTLQTLYDLLLKDLSSDNWELRHGAALGLREVFLKKKANTHYIGKLKTNDHVANMERNEKYLQDLCCNILNIFARDRFSDFIGDSVVAPVKASAAQALAAIFNSLDDIKEERLLYLVFENLEKLILQNGLEKRLWQVSHGGLLGLLYFTTTKKDFFIKNNLLTRIIAIVKYGLTSYDDDVQSVAAGILIPLTDLFLELDETAISDVLDILWNCVVNRDDDLSTSISSIMDLLSNLFKYQKIVNLMAKKISKENKWSYKELIPMLYPYLRHPITIVRASVLELLSQFLEIYDNNDGWISSTTVRLLLQNILFETNTNINKQSQTVYFKVIDVFAFQNDKGSLDTLFGGFLAEFAHLLMTPIGEIGKSYPMSTSKILKPSSSYYLEETHNGSKKRKHSDVFPNAGSHHINIDSAMINGDVDILGKEVILNNRVITAMVFGKTATYFLDKSQRSFGSLLSSSMKNPFSTPRFLAAIVIAEFVKSYKGAALDWLVFIFEPEFQAHLLNTSANPNSMIVYKELVPSLKALRTQCQSLLTAFVSVGKLSSSKIPQLSFLVKGEPQAGIEAFDLKMAEKIHDEYYDKLFRHLDNATKITAAKTLGDFKHRVYQAIENFKEALSAKENVIMSSYANALLDFRSDLPTKLSPFIKALMDNIKMEKTPILQKRSIIALVKLLERLETAGKLNVVNKVVKNLCGFLCVDTISVPGYLENKEYTGRIYDLIFHERSAILSSDPVLLNARDKAKIKTKGGLDALEFLINNALKAEGDFSLKMIPQLDSWIFDPIMQYIKIAESNTTPIEIEDNLGSQLVDSFAVLRQIVPILDQNIIKLDLETVLLPNLLIILKSEKSILRFSSSMALAALAKTAPRILIPFIVENVLPMVNNGGSVTERQGGIELIKQLTFVMGNDILPFVVFFIVPLLGRMSDSDVDIRTVAAKTFATVIKLIPLEEGIKDPEGFSEEFLKGREKERDFLLQMMDPSKIKPFELPVAVNATLRKYQQDGVNWLAFLNKYNLHGILCDDMGLGKTLQTICIIGSDQFMRSEKFAEDKSVENRPLPCLIVCPPSLTGHWEQEFNQYSPGLKVLVYAGPPKFRYQWKDDFNDYSIVVTSYDVVRQDLDIISKYDYNYCVLDEGHIIKNPHSKLSVAVKEIKANHRLLLTGTPIQNNVVELWSLFDFLMPGFLGTEKTFQERFSKPILQSKNPKATARDQEKGVLALESLHKQTLPFMLRRLKDDVLSDLPPKIIQDYYCELSPLQRQLYDSFTKKEKRNVEIELDNSSASEDSEPKQHIFQALQYMRKLCNHPSLILTPSHPQYNKISQQLAAERSTIKDIKHAPKLQALRNLLMECGIGVKNDNNIISQHRVLVFCQLKDMLDLIEKELFVKNMPDVTFMRLDGSIDSKDRQKVVRSFNEDPSIDVLLLTTKVGGLGLNLTGADTVIFVEHDWNPMNDLQAMDRAHRLGQTKVVNVYRIITKGSLEEKIMSLQKFKMNIASTVVNQQNAGLQSMETHQLLDLFDGSEESSSGSKEQTEVNGDGLNEEIVDESGLSGKAKSAMGTLADVWDDSQYQEEYNLDNFIHNLK